MKAQRYQYRQRFEPLDDGGPPPEMTPEIWRPTVMSWRRTLPIAILAPSFFFVDDVPAPDTGEWRFQEPEVRQAPPRAQPEATALTIEAGDFPGLEYPQPPPSRIERRRQPKHVTVFFENDPSIDFPGLEYQQPPILPNGRRQPSHINWFYPPEQAPPNPDDGLAPFTQPYQPPRRLPQQPSAHTEPPDTAVAPEDTGEWRFLEPEVRGRIKRVLAETFLPIEVTPPNPDDGLAPFEAPYQPPRRVPQQPAAYTEPPDVTPAAPEDALEWLFHEPAVGRRRAPSFPDALSAPPEVLPDTLEWIFYAPAIPPRAPAALPEAVFPPPEVPAAPPVDALEWLFQVPYQPPRRVLPACDFYFEPPHIVSTDPDSLEWRFQEPFIWSRRTLLRDRRARLHDPSFSLAQPIDQPCVPVADFSHYNIYRQTKDGAVYQAELLIAQSPTDSYIDLQVNNGTTYRYRVSAVDLSGNESTPTSYTADITPTGPAPSRRVPWREDFTVFTKYRSGQQE